MGGKKSFPWWIGLPVAIPSASAVWRGVSLYVLAMSCTAPEAVMNSALRPARARRRVGRRRAAVCGLLLVLAASASGQSPAVPPNGYGEGWYVSEFWSGEYPPGFSVTRKDTVVQARARMDKTALREVACKLPYLAVIHPWNRNRIAKSKIKFLSATKIIRLVAKEPFVYELAVRDAPAVKIRLKKGDAIEYVRNDAEGSFEVRIAGKQYTANQNLFDHVEDVAQDQFVEDDWASLACEGGNRAYILLSDLVLEGGAGERTAGVSGVGPGQTGYGRARDLKAAEAQELENAGGR